MPLKKTISKPVGKCAVLVFSVNIFLLTGNAFRKLCNSCP